MARTTDEAAMDSRQITLVKESFDKIKPYANKIPRIFYGRLFELAPHLKPLFKKDIRDQRRKFIKTLIYIIDNLSDAEKVGDKLKALAKKHSLYNLEERDYEIFGEALIFSISAALGDNFTTPVKNAWKNTYLTISQIMIKESK